MFITVTLHFSSTIFLPFSQEHISRIRERRGLVGPQGHFSPTATAFLEVLKTYPLNLFNESRIWNRDSVLVFLCSSQDYFLSMEL